MKSLSNTLREFGKDSPNIKTKKTLPPKPSLFVDRFNISNIILKQLKSEQSGHRILLHGLPGTGKSVLMLELAHELAVTNKYDYVIWLDCQHLKFGESTITASPTALKDIFDIIRELSLILDYDASLRVTINLQIQYLRTYLSKIRCLILIDSIDDIQDEETEIFFLALPDTIDIIATSRNNRLWDDDYEILPYDKNDKNLTLLIERNLDKRHLTITQTIVEKIIEISEGIPQMVVFITDLMKQGTDINDIVTGFYKNDMNIFTYYFDTQLKYILKSEDLRKCSYLFAIAQPISIVNTKSVLEILVDKSLINDTIAKLRKMHLIELEEDSIFMRRICREFVVKISEQNLDELINVVQAWSIATKSRIIKAQNYSTWNEVFSFIDTFRLELLSVINWIIRLNRDELFTMGREIIVLSAYYLYSRGLWNDLLLFVEWLIPVAIKDKQYKCLLEVAMTWALRVFRYSRDIDYAKVYYKKVLKVLCANFQITKEIRSYLGVVNVGIHVYDDRIYFTKKLNNCANSLIKQGDYEWACRAMIHVGNELSNAKKNIEAQQAFEWVMETAELYIQFPWANEMKALSLGNLGILSNRREDWIDAKKKLSCSFNGLAQKYDMATCKGELSLACYKLNDINGAILNMKECEILKIELGIRKTVMESKLGWDMEFSSNIPKYCGKLYKIKQFIGSCFGRQEGFLLHNK
jgi:hypothetical protein